VEVTMWRFDAWAVRDGLAFVSDRNGEALEARGTVFMSVPDLEPVPVGRISTALRATRANFQDGFRNNLDEEFAFETLEQVQEVIRRGYLASGLGPAAAAVEGGEEPPAGGPFGHDYEPLPHSEPPNSGSEHYENSVVALGRSGYRMDFSALADPRSRLKLLIQLHKERNWAL